MRRHNNVLRGEARTPIEEQLFEGLVRLIVNDIKGGISHGNM